MESETNDNAIVVDCDLGDSFVLWQEVVIPVIHITMIVCKCIVTPCSIFEYDVEHRTSFSLLLTIVFPSNNLIVRRCLICKECFLIHTLSPLSCM